MNTKGIFMTSVLGVFGRIHSQQSHRPPLRRRVLTKYWVLKLLFLFLLFFSPGKPCPLGNSRPAQMRCGGRADHSISLQASTVPCFTPNACSLLQLHASCSSLLKVCLPSGHPPCPGPGISTHSSASLLSGIPSRHGGRVTFVFVYNTELKKKLKIIFNFQVFCM